MKLKQVALLVLGLFVSGQALGMQPIPGTPRGREQLLKKTDREIERLQKQYRQEYSRLSGEAEVPEELGILQQRIKEKQAFANYIREVIRVSETPEEIGESETAVFGAGVSETPEERERAYYNLLKATDISENDKEILIANSLQRARSEGDVWVNRLLDPQEGLRQAGVGVVPPSPPSPPSPSSPPSPPSLPSPLSSPSSAVAVAVPQFTIGRKTTGAIITAIAIAIATYIGTRIYQKKKNRLIRKYKLAPLTNLQNSVWRAIALAHIRMPWYLQYLIKNNKGTVSDFLGSDPRAAAELYYGRTANEADVQRFIQRFFGGMK